MQFGRRLLRQQVRGGDSPSYIRIVLLLYATDDWANLFQRLSSKYGKYNKTYNQDKSCHIIREPPGDNLHQKDCCALRIIIGAGTDQTIHFIRYFSFPYDDNPNTAYAGTFAVGCFKVDSCKVYHRFYYFFGYKYSIKNEVGENIVTGLANRNLLLKIELKWTLGKHFQ